MDSEAAAGGALPLSSSAASGQWAWAADLLADADRPAAEAKVTEDGPSVAPSAASLRRRDFLLRVLADQYGAGCVVYRGPYALDAAAAVPGMRAAVYDPAAIASAEGAIPELPPPAATTGAETSADASIATTPEAPPPADATAPAAAPPPPLCAIDVLVDGAVARIALLSPSAPQSSASGQQAWRVVEAAAGMGGFGPWGAAVARSLGVEPAAAASPPAVGAPPPADGVAPDGFAYSLPPAADCGGKATLVTLRHADAKVAASLGRCCALADALFSPVI